MVEILDATLREGEQTPGVYFEGHNKMEIAEKLDECGVDYIEAGHPVVSHNIYQAVKKIARMGLRAKVAAHARSIRSDVDRALECDVDFLGIFYCVSHERLQDVFHRDLGYALERIGEVIAYAREQKPDLIIRYTPEDTVRSNFDNVLAASVAALQAGADIISIADTTGYMVPGTSRSMYDFVLKLRKGLEEHHLQPKIAVHCHNDRGLALANALDAFRAGASIIDTTVLSLGERAGIVDLAQVLTVLTSDFGEKARNLPALSSLYEFVSMYANFPIPKNAPLMGENAFTHCAGVHSHAAIVNPLHYQSLDPTLVDRKMKISLDHMSGVSAVEYALLQIGWQNTAEEFLLQVLEQVKQIGETGRTVHDMKELERIALWCEEGRG